MIMNSVPALATAETALSPREELEMIAHDAASAAQRALSSVLTVGAYSNDAIEELENADATIMNALRIMRQRRPAHLLDAAD